MIRRASTHDFKGIKDLMKLYKESIGEEPLTEQQLTSLKDAIQDESIEFYVIDEEACLVGMCSVTYGFSTYQCKPFGVFEDFYIKSHYRHQGNARALSDYVFKSIKEKDIQTLWVGSADIDLEMYDKLGFDSQLGHLLAWNS